jgi:hypothetical protein
MENLSDSHTNYTEVAAYLKKHIDYAGCLLVELAYEKNTRVTRALEAAFRWGTSQGTPLRSFLLGWELAER